MKKAEPRPDMNIKVAGFTVSEKSINTKLLPIIAIDDRLVMIYQTAMHNHKHHLLGNQLDTVVSNSWRRFAQIEAFVIRSLNKQKVLPVLAAHLSHRCHVL